MRTAVVLLAGLLVAGCGSSQERAVADAAQAFGDAVAAGDAARACALLAPSTTAELEDSTGQPCAQALAAQDLVTVERVRRVERYGRQALVAVEDGAGQADTWFLSRFDGRWLLVAAACRPRPELPYDCEVEGP